MRLVNRVIITLLFLTFFYTSFTIANLDDDHHHENDGEDVRVRPIVNYVIEKKEPNKPKKAKLEFIKAVTVANLEDDHQENDEEDEEINEVIAIREQRNKPKTKKLVFKKGDLAVVPKGKVKMIISLGKLGKLRNSKTVEEVEEVKEDQDSGDEDAEIAGNGIRSRAATANAQVKFWQGHGSLLESSKEDSSKSDTDAKSIKSIASDVADKILEDADELYLSLNPEANQIIWKNGGGGNGERIRKLGFPRSKGSRRVVITAITSALMIISLRILR